MSRSLKRAPVLVCGSGSDKWWKRFWHQKMRAAERSVLHEFDGHNDFLPHQCELSDVWESRKDWVMRFDPRQHPEWMRK